MAAPGTTEVSVEAPEWLELVRPIGAGGMGQVFEALDTRKSERVAVKTMAEFQGLGLLRLKNEFRSFADVVHPNLVALHELVEFKGQWFLVMELIDGVDCRRHVRGQVVEAVATPHQPSSATDATRTAAVRTSSLVDLPQGPHDVGPLRGSAPGLATFVDVARQLALGLQAIHRSGQLHRDVKPSNVMVDRAGRAVLLDFGIAQTLEQSRRSAGETDAVVGTPGYLAPELLTGAAPSAASDWYAFGVLCFELLTGVRPFSGTTDEVFRAKLAAEAPQVERVADGIPPALASLVNGLLRRSPAERPDATEVLQVLSGGEVAPANSPAFRSELVGRERELTAVLVAAEQARVRPRALFLRGRSGVGKSAVLDTALRALHSAGAVVLSGRCYEHESLPYKAVDKLVDAVLTVLQEHPNWVADVLPSDRLSLGRAFPVLTAVLGSAPPADSSGDSADLTRRALEALAELLQSLARKAPLVCCVDDLQWGDAESIGLFAQLQRPGSAPLLVLGGFRAEDESTSPALKALHDSFVQATGASFETLEVLPLSAADSTQLATVLAAEAGVNEPAKIAWAQRESQGEPYFLHELIFFAAGSAQLSSGTTLKEVLSARVGRLSAEARELLEVVALAGREVTQAMVDDVSGLKNLRRAQQELRSSRLVRTSGPNREDLIDTFHDKVREVVGSQVPVERARAVHAGLFEAWASLASKDVGRLYAMADHASRAGALVEPARAFSANVEAAQVASQVFDTVRARSMLLEAQRLASANGLAFAADLQLLLADTCLLLGDVDASAAAFQAVLDSSRESYQRARAHQGFARLRFGQLDTEGCWRECNLALKELGIEELAASTGNMLRAVAGFLATWVRRQLGRARLTSDDLPRDALVARLFYTAAYAGYFLFNSRLFMQGILRGYTYVLRLGTHREASNWYGASAALTAVIGRVRLSRQLAALAREKAKESNDPGAVAFTEYAASLAIDMSGAPDEAAGIARACIEQRSQWLENADFFTLVANSAWMMMMRGHPVQAWEWLSRALQRSVIDGKQSLLSRGHTFRCYAGPALAMLGRDAEGLQHLDQYQAFLTEFGATDLWRKTQHLCHRALYLQLVGASDAELEAVFAAHDALGIKAKAHPQQLRQFFLARGYRRLEQAALVREKTGAPPALDAVDLALKELHSFVKHPTLGAHYQVMSGVRAWLAGADGTPAFAAAGALARAHDIPWVALEVELWSARAQLERGQFAAAAARLEAVKVEATARCLVPLARRASELLSRPHSGRPG